MINKISNIITFRNDLNNSAASSGLQKNSNKEFKKDYFQKHYDDLYTRDKHLNNNYVGIFGIGSLLCFVGSFIMKEQKYKSEFLFAGLGLAAGSLVSYAFKPKKEKYDAQVQIELNKEVTDESSSNK